MIVDPMRASKDWSIIDKPSGQQKVFSIMSP